MFNDYEYDISDITDIFNDDPDEKILSLSSLYKICDGINLNINNLFNVGELLLEAHHKRASFAGLKHRMNMQKKAAAKAAKTFTEMTKAGGFNTLDTLAKGLVSEVAINRIPMSQMRQALIDRGVSVKDADLIVSKLKAATKIFTKVHGLDETLSTSKDKVQKLLASQKGKEAMSEIFKIKNEITQILSKPEYRKIAKKAVTLDGKNYKGIVDNTSKAMAKRASAGAAATTATATVSAKAAKPVAKLLSAPSNNTVITLGNYKDLQANLSRITKEIKNPEVSKAAAEIKKIGAELAAAEKSAASSAANVKIVEAAEKAVKSGGSVEAAVKEATAGTKIVETVAENLKTEGVKNAEAVVKDSKASIGSRLKSVFGKSMGGKGARTAAYSLMGVAAATLGYSYTLKNDAMDMSDLISKDEAVLMACKNKLQALAAKDDTEGMARIQKLYDEYAAGVRKKDSTIAKITNGFNKYYNNFCEAVRGYVNDGIGMTGSSSKLLIAGFGSSILLMVLGAIIYSKTADASAGSMIVSKFQEAFSEVSSSGPEKVIQALMAPIRAMFRIISVSPLGSVLFIAGLMLLSVMVVGTIIGWDVLFPKKQTMSYIVFD